MCSLYHIAIAEENDIMLHGLTHIFSNQSSFCVTTVSDGRELLQLVRNQKFDIAIISTSLSFVSGIEAMHALQEISPLTSIIAFSYWEDPELILKTKEAGATGFISKDALCTEILAIVKKVLSGKDCCCRISGSKLEAAEKAAIMCKGKAKIKKLTARDLVILEYSRLGYSNKETGEKMKIPLRTISDLKIKIGLKTNTSKITEMINYALDKGLLPLKEKLT